MSKDNAKTDDDSKFLGFVDGGPPPDLRQRRLIFDSFAKFTGRTDGRQKPRARTGSNRGTFIFTWGAGYHGQLGRLFKRGQKKYSAVPAMVESNFVVRQVACGGLHTALVTENGDVYTWGDGRNSQLGQSEKKSLLMIPTVVEKLTSVHVVQVACGQHHTLALTDTGDMFSWGCAKFGQTGHDKRGVTLHPERIAEFAPARTAFKIVEIACGNRHSLALSKKGEVLSWGCDVHGQIGQRGESTKSEEGTFKPTKIAEFDNLEKKIVSIACGSIHSCFITEQGELFLCGFGEYFCRNKTQHFFYKPKQIPMIEPLKQIACGQSHNVALSRTGNVYTWGSGEYGQLGCGMFINCRKPRIVLENKDIAQVAAGRYHSFALTNAGQLYSWGCGENGQLGLNSDDNVPLPKVVTHILGTVVGQIACGEHHTAVLTSAPWSKLSQDSADWLAAAKHEHQTMEGTLKNPPKPDPEQTGPHNQQRENLKMVKEAMDDFRKSEALAKSAAFEEEELVQQNEISKILFQDDLLPMIHKDIEIESTNDDVNLPEIVNPQVMSKRFNLSVPDQVESKTEEKEKIRFPRLHKSKASKSTKSSQPFPQVMTQNGNLQAPSTRTTFLKETAQMVNRMKNVVQEKGEATNQRELQRMIRMVFTFRKEYDQLRNHSRNLANQVEVLRKEQKLLEKSCSLSDASYKQCYEQLDALDMQLNTFTIKIAETSENRRNYELNIAHLKEEDFDKFTQLKVLRKQNSDNSNFFKKMLDLQLQANEEKNKAVAELEDFRQEIKAYQKFVDEQLRQFESILGIVRAQSEKRSRAKAIRQEKTHAKIAQRIDKLQSEAEAAQKQSQGLTSHLDSIGRKLRHFEDSFQKITAATGLVDPDAIVNKFKFKEDIKEQLDLEIENKQKQIEKLKADEAELKENLFTAKQNFKHDTWHDVEVLTEESRNVEFTSATSQQELAQARERLTFAQEGMLSLLANLDKTLDKSSLSMEVPESELWTEDQTKEVFNKVSEAVTVLLEVEKEKIAKEEEARKEAENKKIEEGTLSAFLPAAMRPEDAPVE